MEIKELLRKIYYWRMYRKLQACGANVIFSSGGQVKRPDELTIGSNVFVGRNFLISARSMKIGNNVMIGPNFLAECDDHIYDMIGKPMFSVREERKIEPITIENDVWIGGGVTILKGVTIGEGAVIGAGSLVVKDVFPYTVSCGVPCKPIKQRFTDDKLKQHIELVGSSYTFEEIVSQWKAMALQGK